MEAERNQTNPASSQIDWVRILVLITSALQLIDSIVELLH